MNKTAIRILHALPLETITAYDADALTYACGLAANLLDKGAIFSVEEGVIGVQKFLKENA